MPGFHRCHLVHFSHHPQEVGITSPISQRRRTKAQDRQLRSGGSGSGTLAQVSLFLNPGFLLHPISARPERLSIRKSHVLFVSFAFCVRNLATKMRAEGRVLSNNYPSFNCRWRGSQARGFAVPAAGRGISSGRPSGGAVRATAGVRLILALYCPSVSSQVSWWLSPSFHGAAG